MPDIRKKFLKSSPSKKTNSCTPQATPRTGKMTSGAEVHADVEMKMCEFREQRLRQTRTSEYGNMFKKSSPRRPKFSELLKQHRHRKAPVRNEGREEIMSNSKGLQLTCEMYPLSNQNTEDGNHARSRLPQMLQYSCTLQAEKRSAQPHLPSTKSSSRVEGGQTPRPRRPASPSRRPGPPQVGPRQQHETADS